MNIDSNFNDLTESEYYNKSLLVKYKRFSKRYILNNADTFDSYDWANISLFASLDIKMILRFKHFLNPSLLNVNTNINPEAVSFIKKNSNKVQTYSFIYVINGDSIHRVSAIFLEWK